jgi:hypothetical protein
LPSNDAPTPPGRCARRPPSGWPSSARSSGAVGRPAGAPRRRHRRSPATGSARWRRQLLARAGGGRPAPRRERIDPFTLGEPWRLRVREALRAQSRYREALERTADGPLKERLADIGRRIDAGVDECWRIANQGDAISAGMRAVRLGEVRASLAAAERDAGGGAEADADPGSPPCGPRCRRPSA